MNQDLVDVLDLTVEQLAALFDGVPGDSERVIYSAKGIEADVLDVLLDVDEGDEALAIVGRRTMTDQVIAGAGRSNGDPGSIEISDGFGEADPDLLARGLLGTYHDVAIVVLGREKFADFGGVERIGPDQLLVLVRSGQHRKLVDTSLTPEPAAAAQDEGQRADEPAPLNFPTSTFTPGALRSTNG
jgi:hypothetical protein